MGDVVLKLSSTPSFLDFDPTVIPWQYQVIYNVEKVLFKDSSQTHEILLSGSVGSAKSVLGAWLALRHITKYEGSRVLLGRKALPDLKDTIFQKILEMLVWTREGDLIIDKDYWVNTSRASITFANGSEIISRSWHDKKYKKMRSLEVSMILIEEMTENDSKESEAFYTEMVARVGRLPHIPENLVVVMTNPDDPTHYCYKYFIEGAKKFANRHVVYSLTEDNPFLEPWYIDSLKEKYTAKQIERYLLGRWIFISTDVIYYEYDPDKHYVLENTTIDYALPIRISFDFNIAKGKPMSSVLFQYDERKRLFKIIDEVVIEGAKTQNALDEWVGKGYFDTEFNPQIIIHGDATGRHSDTRSNSSDYDIIEKFLSNYIRRQDGKALHFEIEVPRSNPPVRDRHNILNGQLFNAKKRISILIDKRCKEVHEGLTNTRLKEAASYTEDQTTRGQDISTALGYGVYAVIEGNHKVSQPITFS